MNGAAALRRPRLPGAVQLALAAALLALGVSGVAGPGGLMLLGAALAVAAIRTRRGSGTVERAEAWASLASGLYLMFYLVDVLALSRNLLGASLRLLVFLSILRLFVARTDREWLQLLLISFLAMVAATASTTEVAFVLPLAAYTAAALRALSCRQEDRWSGPLRTPGRRNALRTAGVLTLGLALFFAIPHVGTGYFRAGGRIRQPISGFSGRIELGSINRIKKNHDIVMRVRMEGDAVAGVAIRWRGVAFEEYDGRAWSRASAETSWLQPRLDGFRVSPTTGLPRLEYEVTLEPIQSPALFAAAEPIRVTSDDFFLLGSQDESGIFLNHLRRSRVSYRVVSELRSALRLADRAAGAGRDYPPWIVPGYLQLPPLDPRLAALAADLAAGETDPYWIARRMEEGLRTRYRYTLDVDDEGVPDPLARFLLEGAPGHCEYFATAMAVLLRVRQVPARVVTGFQRGDFSDLHGTVLVRQSDAHSWVEVYFPGMGWVEFDPTPPLPPEQGGGLLAGLRRMMERVEVAWDTWVVGLDLNDQASVLRTARSAAAEALARAGAAVSRRWHSGDSMRWAGRAALALAGLATLLAVGRWAAAAGLPRLPLPGSRRGPRPDELTRLYRRFQTALARRGIRRPPHLTPLEFARLAGEHGMPAEVQAITEWFCAARYGGAPLEARDLARAERWIRRLRRGA